jgi:hypothetical protein
MDLPSFVYTDHLALRILEVNRCDLSGVCFVHALEAKCGTVKNPDLPRHPSESNQIKSTAVVQTVNCNYILFFFLSFLLPRLLIFFFHSPLAFLANTLLRLRCVFELNQLLGEVCIHKLSLRLVNIDWHFDLVVPLQFALVLDAIEQFDVALVTSHNQAAVT